MIAIAVGTKIQSKKAPISSSPKIKSAKALNPTYAAAEDMTAPPVLAADLNFNFALILR